PGSPPRSSSLLPMAPRAPAPTVAAWTRRSSDAGGSPLSRQRPGPSRQRHVRTPSRRTSAAGSAGRSPSNEPGWTPPCRKNSSSSKEEGGADHQQRPPAAPEFHLASFGGRPHGQGASP